MKKITIITLLIFSMITIASAKNQTHKKVYSNFTTVHRVDTIYSKTDSTFAIQESKILKVSGTPEKISSIENMVIDVLITNKSKFFPTNWKFLKKEIYKLSGSHYLVDYLKGDNKGNSEGYILVLDLNYKEVYMALTKSFSKGLSITSHIKYIGNKENEYFIEIEYESEETKRSEVVHIK